jgi:hypothetical protein
MLQPGQGARRLDVGVDEVVAAGEVFKDPKTPLASPATDPGEVVTL